MIAVIVEAVPRPGRTGDYFETVARLRPLIEGITGFESSERFESLSEPGKFMSLSIFRDETSASACLERMEERIACQPEMFSQYRVRLASIADGNLKHVRQDTRAARRGFFGRLLPA